MSSEEAKGDELGDVVAIGPTEEQGSAFEAVDPPSLGLERDVEEDEETWTNQPRGDVTESDTLDSECDEEESDGQPEPSRKRIETSGDVLTEELPYRAEKAAARLKPFLTARVVFEISNTGDKYLFEWTEQGPRVSHLGKDAAIRIEGEGTVEEEASHRVDTVICLSERSVMAIRSGDLNTQVGMLTDKIRVSGQIAPAVYIFNVIAPRSRP